VRAEGCWETRLETADDGHVMEAEAMVLVLTRPSLSTLPVCQLAKSDMVEQAHGGHADDQRCPHLQQGRQRCVDMAFDRGHRSRIIGIILKPDDRTFFNSAPAIPIVNKPPPPLPPPQRAAVCMKMQNRHSQIVHRGPQDARRASTGPPDAEETEGGGGGNRRDVYY